VTALRDVLVIMPTRGRPQRATAALDAVFSLAETALNVVACYDDDDPQAPVYAALPPRENVSWRHGPADTPSGWANRIAAENTGNYRAFFSMGDDHMPRTHGWDRLLLEAIAAIGGTGFAYGDDYGQGRNLATAVMVSADIVEMLGYLMLPSCAHYHVDNVWMDLGKGANCIAWCPNVVVEHAHLFWGKAPVDETYRSSSARSPADMAAYDQWRAEGKDADVAKIAALMAGR
jgi:hypothetical protein